MDLQILLSSDQHLNPYNSFFSFFFHALLVDIIQLVLHLNGEKV
jgi:hypothetical protein